MMTINDLFSWLKGYFPRLINGRIPVDIGSSSVGGSSFDGQLKQDSANVSSANPLPVRTITTAAVVVPVSVATHATNGATMVAFPAQACTSLDVVNESIYDIEYQRGGSGGFITIPGRSGREIDGISNAGQIAIRRVDQVATPITIKAEARS